MPRRSRGVVGIAGVGYARKKERKEGIGKEAADGCGNDYANDAPAPRDQAAGSSVGLVASFVDLLPDPLLDLGLVIDHSRHRGARDSCLLGDFLQSERH